MKTLYDLLGALADDGAEDLRTAFRRAVKGTHPDLNPDDPDAALKFRQIVRANEILSDEEQRAIRAGVGFAARRRRRASQDRFRHDGAGRGRRSIDRGISAVHAHIGGVSRGAAGQGCNDRQFGPARGRQFGAVAGSRH
jgi:curved DNA-binding protein CbpA